jgi:hypothetical protein
MSTIPTLREELLDQHQGLRHQLQELRQVARAVVSGDPQAGDHLVVGLKTFLRTLEAHMAYEELHLEPALHGSSPGGVRYVSLLHEDHVCQRAELDRLERQCDDPDDQVSLALAVQEFVADVLLDIEEEELQFVTEALLGPAGRVTASPADPCT